MGQDDQRQSTNRSQQPAARIVPERLGERKLVTVMFADISGFTALSEKMDPEDLSDLMNACFEQLVPVVTKYGGTVDKFIGDEIMALFGAPVAHENDPERALRAALEMMDAMAAFNAAHAIDLGIHFGINSGLVVAGGVGTRERQDYSVMGDTVNLAARLEDASERGEILVGPDTYRLTSHVFAFETRPPMRLKGKAEPVRIYKLLSFRAQPEPVRGLEGRGISSPLVARAAELAALRDSLAQLRAGRGRIVFVLGEVGLGKSRLLAEARRESADGGLRWLEGRGLSFGQTISYWPFLEILKSDIGITEQDGEVESWTKLESRVQALFPEQVAEILPYLATLLALEVRGDLAARVKYLDAEALHRQIFLACRRFFERLAQERPLVLVFEDAHWADESSTDLLEHLFPLVETLPLLICCVSRPDPQVLGARLWELATQKYAEHSCTITLAPLSASDSAQLMRNLLQVEDLPPSVRQVILTKAEGNPFFVEEVIRALIDLQTIVRDQATGRWQVTPSAEQVHIPDTLHGVIMARIDRLDEEVKQVLRVASVIGRSFFYRILRVIAEAGQRVDQRLAELQQLELVHEKTHTPELEYIFKHALTQEATYESILLRRRRELHRQVGECIEALFAERLEEFYGLLAYHYARAEEWEKAQEYLLKAGDRASELAADAEALAHYREALAVYERVFGDRWDPFQRAVLERKMGEALFRRGDHQGAREYLERALGYLGSPWPTSRSGVRLAIVRQLLQQAGHRLLPGLFLQRPTGGVDPTVEERARIYEAMGWMDYWAEQERLILDALLLLNVSERSGFAPGIARGSMGAGLACDLSGIFWLAERYHTRAVALADQTENPIVVGLTYLGLAIHEHYGLGRLARAVEYYRRAAAAYWEAGELRGWATATGLMGVVLGFTESFTRVRELGQEIVRVGQDAADDQAWAFGLEVLGAVLWRTGAVVEGIAHLHKAIELFKAIPDYHSLVGTMGDLGQCYLRQGEVQQALTVLEESQRIIAQQGLRGSGLGFPFTGLAEGYLLAAEQAQEREQADALRRAKRACQAILNHSKRDRESLPRAHRWQGTYEWLRGKPAAAQESWQRSVALAEESGARYDLGLTYLEIGRHMGERSHLERAAAILAELGASLDAARARQLLKPGDE